MWLQKGEVMKYLKAFMSPWTTRTTLIYYVSWLAVVAIVETIRGKSLLGNWWFWASVVLSIIGVTAAALIERAKKNKEKKR